MQVPGPRNPGLRHPAQTLCQQGPARIGRSRDTDPLASRGRALEPTWRRGGDSRNFGTFRVCFGLALGSRGLTEGGPSLPRPARLLRVRGVRTRPGSQAEPYAGPGDTTPLGSAVGLAAGHVPVTWVAERAPGVSAGLPAPSAAHARARPTWGRRRLSHPPPCARSEGLGPRAFPPRSPPAPAAAAARVPRSRSPLAWGRPQRATRGGTARVAAVGPPPPNWLERPPPQEAPQRRRGASRWVPASRSSTSRSSGGSFRSPPSSR